MCVLYVFIFVYYNYKKNDFFEFIIYLFKYIEYKKKDFFNLFHSFPHFFLFIQTRQTHAANSRQYG